MVSRQSLGDDTLNGRDDGPNLRHHSVLSLKNASLNFGTVTVGDSRVLADTLINNSASTVVVKRAILADGNFKVDVPLPLTLAAGAVLPLFATAMTSTTPQLAVSPSSISFGPVIVGSSSQPQVMTLTNPGGNNLIISQVTATGSGFRLSGITLPLTIASGQSITCSVTFTPQSTGTVSGGVSINISSGGATVSSNGKGGGPKKGSSTTTVPLAGTGVAAGLLAASPSAMGFGSVSIGSSRTTSTTLTNSGGSNLTISQATAAGSGFSLSGLTLPLTLTPNQSATLNVTFAPQSSGSVNGGITV